MLPHTFVRDRDFAAVGSQECPSWQADIFRHFAKLRIICPTNEAGSLHDLWMSFAIHSLLAAFNMVSQLTCPTCGHRVIPEETPSMPFCSVRCQHVDLGRWFNQEIGMPVEPDENSDNEEASHS